MATQANVTAVHGDEDEDEATSSTLSIELDAMPGAVWQTELSSSLPSDVRVTLFERGAQKCALLMFPPGQRRRAFDAFDAARRAANAVSQEAYLAAQAARQRARS